MKKILQTFLCCLICFHVLGQAVPDSLPPRQDTPVVKKQDSSTVRKKDSGKVIKTDSTRKRDTIVSKPKVARDSNRVARDTNLLRKPVKKHIDSVRVDLPPSVPKEEETLPIPAPEIPLLVDVLPGIAPDSTGTAFRLASFQAVLKNHPYYNFDGDPIVVTMREKKVNGREAMFYFLAGLLIYFGFIRFIFGKYLSNLSSLFFRVTMRQQQIREQLLQSPLPSLLLNLLFIVNGGFFLSFVALHYNILPITNQWALMGWSAALLVVIYTGKLILLKLTGWIFNISRLADTYIFVVFLVNKMIGIFLLPVLVILAFAGPVLFKVVMTLTFVMLVIFLLYRFIIAYNPIRNEIKVNRFHFFIYLCAFEIAPLLLIYKVLLIFVERSY